LRVRTWRYGERKEKWGWEAGASFGFVVEALGGEEGCAASEGFNVEREREEGEV
jgi:hypothetical protein